MAFQHIIEPAKPWCSKQCMRFSLPRGVVGLNRRIGHDRISQRARLVTLDNVIILRFESISESADHHVAGPIPNDILDH